MGFDHPELANMVAAFFGAFIAVVWISFFFYGLFNDNVDSLKIPDRFDIGYIDEPQQQVVVVQQKPKKKKKKRKSVPNTGPQHVCTEKMDPLHRDCVDALIALGTKSSEARRVAARVLADNPQIKDVQEFIPIAFQKRN